MITDLDMFIKFFDMMGITYDKYPCVKPSILPGDEEPAESVTHITVSQAIFCFDKDDNYLGALADDMGFFEPKVTNAGRS